MPTAPASGAGPVSDDGPAATDDTSSDETASEDAPVSAEDDASALDPGGMVVGAPPLLPQAVMLRIGETARKATPRARRERHVAARRKTATKSETIIRGAPCSQCTLSQRPRIETRWPRWF